MESHCVGNRFVRVRVLVFPCVRAFMTSIKLCMRIDLFQQEGEVAQHLVRGGLLKRHGCVSLLDKRLYYTWKVRRDKTERVRTVPFSVLWPSANLHYRTTKRNICKVAISHESSFLHSFPVKYTSFGSAMFP